MREKPVSIEVRKAGQHWSVFAEDQLIAQTVTEKGAQTLEATLRGLLRYTSRKLFRLAVSDAMKGPKPAEAAKKPKAGKAKAEPAKAKAKVAAKKNPVKKDRVADTTPASVAPPAPAQSPAEPASPASPKADSPAKK